MADSRTSMDRPTNRSQCRNGPRPCPWVSCRYHLYLDVNRSGRTIKINCDVPPWKMPETCALDIADRGPNTLATIGILLNVSREMIRQIEDKAVNKLAKHCEKDQALKDFLKEK